MNETKIPSAETEAGQEKLNESAYKRVDQLQAESKFARTNEGVNTIIEIAGEKFSIERIKDPESADLSQVQSLFEEVFGAEEVDPEEILRNAVGGRSAFDPEQQDIEYKVFTVKDKEGKVISVVSGGILELIRNEDEDTKENIFMVAYAVTDPSARQGGLAREAYISALQHAAEESEQNGKKLAFAAGECTYTSEKFWNKVGWERLYKKTSEGNFKEIEYIQPALDFDENTGLPAEDAGEAPEHLMIDGFGESIKAEDAIATVAAFYQWCNMWPPEAFESDEAYKKHQAYVEEKMAEFKEQFEESGELRMMKKSEREAMQKNGMTVEEFTAADHGDAGEEDF